MALWEGVFDISYLAVLLTLSFAFYIPVVLNIFMKQDKILRISSMLSG